MSKGKHSRIGIVLWTANKYISEHPRCGLGEVMRHTCNSLSMRSVSYMSMKAGRCKFWTRTRGRLPGSNRIQWLYSVNVLGQELAEAPRPPSLHEVLQRSERRAQTTSHAADWATDAQLGELLVPRGGNPVWVQVVSQTPQSTYLMPGEVLVLCQAFYSVTHYAVSQRPINFGNVHVIASSGQIVSVGVDRVRPLQRRKYTRPTLNIN